MKAFSLHIIAMQLSYQHLHYMYTFKVHLSVVSTLIQLHVKSHSSLIFNLLQYLLYDSSISCYLVVQLLWQDNVLI